MSPVPAATTVTAPDAATAAPAAEPAKRPAPAAMPRRLILLRHAKASRDAPSDHARPLTKRGRRDAMRVGLELAGSGLLPQIVASSDSERTLETWRFLRGAFRDHPMEAVFTRRLYLGGLDEIREAASAWPAEATAAMIIGHNPGMESALKQLTGEDHELPTCAAACLACDAPDWNAALRARWRIERILRPKELAD